MDFGRLADIEGVDFGLAPIDAFGALGGERRAGQRLFVGAPAWAKKRFVGRVYPPGTQSRDYLAAYAAAYGAVELNATFYRTPDADEARAWSSVCPAGFRFAPKVPRTIASARRLEAPAAELARFASFATALGERCGPALLTLPPSFPDAEIGALATLRAALPASIAIAVEARHPRFFHDRALTSRAREAFMRLGLTAVITDVAGRRDASHGTHTTTTAFVRFVGNALHPTDFARVDAWAERFAELFTRGLETAYFFVHEPDDETTPELLSYAATRFEAATGLQVAAPRLGGRAGQLALF